MRIHDALAPAFDDLLGDLDGMQIVTDVQEKIFDFLMKRHSIASDLEAEKPLKAIALYEQSAFDEWPGKTSYHRIPILRRKTKTVPAGIQVLERLLVDCACSNAKFQIDSAIENLKNGRQD